MYWRNATPRLDSFASQEVRSAARIQTTLLSRRRAWHTAGVFGRLLPGPCPLAASRHRPGERRQRLTGRTARSSATLVPSTNDVATYHGTRRRITFDVRASGGHMMGESGTGAMTRCRSCQHAYIGHGLDGCACGCQKVTGVLLSGRNTTGEAMMRALFGDDYAEHPRWSDEREEARAR